MRTRTPLPAVRLDGVSHAFVWGELIDGRGHAGYPMDLGGSTAKVLLLCRPGFLLVDPGTLVLKPDTADIDCMTCLRLHPPAVRVDGVSHAVSEVEQTGNTLSVALLCRLGPDVLVAFGSVVLEPGDTGIDCMTCLVRRSRT